MRTDPSEITQLVAEREKDFTSLYDLMDKDLDMRRLNTTPERSGYEQTTRSKTGVHQTDVEIFSNRPCTFADDVQTILLASEMQIAVRMAEAEGEDKRDDMARLERLFKFILYKGDERLRRLLLPPLKLSLIELALLRGGVAGRFLIYKIKDKIVVDFMSLDPRWLSYEIGSEALLWTSYKTFKSGAALLNDYDYNEGKKDNNTVIDFWENDGDNIINSVICDKTFLKTPTEMRKELGYDLPSMPILIMPVPNRILLTDSTQSKTIAWGESIFAPIRDTIAVRNRFATIVATHASLMAKQPLFNYMTEQGTPITDSSYYAGAVLNIPPGNRIERSPMAEISPTVVNMMNWLNNEVEDATLPRIDIGNPPASGTALNLVQEASKKVFNPQLYLLNNFYGDILRLAEEQLLAGKLKVKIQGQEKNKYYEVKVTPVDLKRPHTTEVEFTARTPYTQQDTAQLAEMLKRQGIPQGFINEYIYKFPDPKGMADLAAIEMYEHSPKGAMMIAIQALIKTKDPISLEKAAQIMRDLTMMEMQEQGMAGQPPPAGAPGEVPAPSPTEVPVPPPPPTGEGI